MGTSQGESMTTALTILLVLAVWLLVGFVVALAIGWVAKDRERPGYITDLPDRHRIGLQPRRRSVSDGDRRGTEDAPTSATREKPVVRRAALASVPRRKLGGRS